MVEYPPGTPCWADLSSPDTEAAARFYGELFGWESAPAGPAGRLRFQLGGERAAAASPLQPGEPPHWKTYIAVEDADAAARAVEDAGGTVVDAPFDVADAGRAAICTDSTGALFVAWQPRRNRGAQAVNRDGAMSWNELGTHDVDAAERFYGAVFGWEVERIEQDGRLVYAIVRLGGRTIGGMLPTTNVPPNWLVYFGVADVDGTAGAAERHGGSVVAPPMEVPAGRFVVVADPQGAVFGCVEGSYDPPPGG